MGQIKCLDQLVDAYRARHAPQEIARQLGLAKSALGYAECLCSQPSKRLAIRERNGRYWLAVYPLDGPNHEQDCPFHHSVTIGAPAADSRSAILESEAGVDVRLDVSLIARKPKDGKPAPRSGDLRPARAGRRRATLLALLEALWAKGDLARWSYGWTRDYGRVKYQLDGAAQSFVVNRRALCEDLYVPPPFRPEEKERIQREWAEFRIRLIPTDPRVARQSKLIAGEVNHIEPTQFGFAIRLRHHAEPIYCTAAIHQLLARRFPRAIAAVALPQGRPMRVFALICVELTTAGHVRVTEASLMGLSRDYLPVDSGLEAQVADLLVDQRRTFEKPLHLDAESSLLPDFVLLDTEPATPMEVFGMKTPDYLERKAEKLLRYQADGVSIWRWDAAHGSAMPPFPPRARRVGAK